MAAGEFRIIVETENKLVCQFPGALVDLVFERRPDELRAFELARRTIAVFNSWLSDDKARDRDTMSVIGSHLYTLLFPSQIDTAFRALWLGRPKEANPVPLRIVLEFRAPAAWLAELPWEFLYLPDTLGGAAGFFLCAKSDLILTRTVQQEGQARSDPHGNRAVNILVVLSQPCLEDTVSDDLVKALEKLRDGIPGRIELRTHIREGTGAGPIKGPTRKDLLGWIEDPDFKPDIVHFLGHGRYAYNAANRLEKGELALVREDNGEADWCSDKDFADFFERVRPPKLVFLHACESGKTASYRGFKGLALSLIGCGVPNVVAMQYQLENAVATKFAGTFYTALLDGVPIDAAVQLGRQALGRELHTVADKFGVKAENFSDRRFGSPVVFVQAWQGLSVFGRTAGSGPGVLPDDLPCPYPGCKNYHKRKSQFCDQGNGELITCVNPACGQLLRKEARTCSYCNTMQVPAAAPALAAAAGADRPAATGLEREALDRFRAAADSSPTHGRSTFGGGRPPI